MDAGRRPVVHPVIEERRLSAGESALSTRRGALCPWPNAVQCSLSPLAGPWRTEVSRLRERSLRSAGALSTPRESALCTPRASYAELSGWCPNRMQRSLSLFDEQSALARQERSLCSAKLSAHGRERSQSRFFSLLRRQTEDCGGARHRRALGRISHCGAPATEQDRNSGDCCCCSGVSAQQWRCTFASGACNKRMCC
ncbi:hypothetical protein AAVH_36856 [Aphelenchoides avenae]|nr:hypothetical protein AAVH_36856 [Aphelenchus avenae]